jgi:ligand-binding SRPBCC domain-containing protein
MSAYRLERSQLIPRPRQEVFAFFSDAANLARITPSFVGFRILTPGPLVIRAGTVIDYQIRLYGFPIRWRTLIESFEPGVAFTDIQVRGPYRTWRHRHSFADAPGGTRMDDTIDYELPLGPMGALVRRMFVARSLQRIFDFRAQCIAAIFPVSPAGISQNARTS